MLKLKPRINRMAEILSMVSFAGFILIALLSAADVILTLFFRRPILGVYEIVEQSMLCAVFCAFAYGQTQKSHITMTLAIAKMPRVPRMILFSLMSILSTFMAGLLTAAAGIQIVSYFRSGITTGMLYVPLWPFYAVECAAMFVFTLTLLYDTVLSVAAIFSQEIADEVCSEWT